MPAGAQFRSSGVSWPPLILRWHASMDSLPRRVFRPSSARRGAVPSVDAGWLATGPADRPFDFTAHVSRLIADVVARCPEFAHIQTNRVLVSAMQARSGREHGLQARITPLRFLGGALTKERRGVRFQVQRFFLGDVEFLYLMTFCLPRFLNQDFDGKFITLFHELFHIGPAFDGDFRRHHGRCQLHTRSQRRYDRQMADLARRYLACKPDPNLHAFLRLDFALLEEKHGSVTGVVVPRPKMVPLLSAMQTAASSP